jgi:kumamolisin
MAALRDFVPLKDSELTHVPGARSMGRVNPQQVAEVLVRVRSAASDDSLDAEVDSISGLRVRERTYLTPEAFAAKFAADATDLAKIESFANDYNLSVEAISPAACSVRVLGTLENLAKAFNVSFANFNSAMGSYRGYTGPVHVPSEISDVVTGVFGLDDKPQSTFHLRKLSAAAMPATRPSGTRSTPGPGYTPIEVAALYNFPASYFGQGQCVAIIEFGGGYRMSDLNSYFEMLGIATPNIVAVSVGRAQNAPTGNPNGPDAEVMLDIQVVGAIVPGAQIVVYFAPNTTLGWLRAVHTAIHDTFHQPSVISISWGGPEASWSAAAMNALNRDFKAAATKGITICAAAGDAGYTDGLPGSKAHVDFPASSPYVLSCGGTRLESSGAGIANETVWNDAPNSATGGGVSDFFAVPPYQSDANIPTSVNSPHHTGRGVPDVAGDADPNTGYRVRVDGHNFIIGGTSAVAPLWAGLLTQVNQKIGAAVGFVNPLLYSEGLAIGGFNDILSGNNGRGGYEAGPGWDACTGLGSPDGTALSDAV